MAQLTVTPNPVTEGETVTVKWAATRATKVRMAWACGAVVVDLSGTSGTFTRVAKCPGNCHVSLRKSDGTVLASMDLTVKAAVVNDRAFVGYGSGTTGGMGGKLFQPATWADFKVALSTSGPRIIRFPANVGVLNGLGETVNIKDGDLTIDGSGSDVIIKRGTIRIGASNVIVTEMRMRPGDQVAAPDDVDAIEINPGIGASLSHVVIDHCSLLWSPDVTLSILNSCSDITVQYCIMACGLLQSTHYEATPPSTHSYGPNVTTVGSNPNPGTEFTQRITFYRNYLAHNWGRNIRGMGTDLIDWVNEVVYDWGPHLSHMNPKRGNVVGNMFKKGPITPASDRTAFTSTDLAFPTVLQNSVFWSANLAMGFTESVEFDAGVLRNAVAGTLSVTAATATTGLAAAVVAAAGPTQVDAVDQLLKDDFTNGTGGYWNGGAIVNGVYDPNAYAGPHPHWP